MMGSPIFMQPMKANFDRFPNVTANQNLYLSGSWVFPLIWEVHEFALAQASETRTIDWNIALDLLLDKYW